MDISKPEMKYVFIVVLKNMAGLLVMNVGMILIKMEKKQIISFAKIAIQKKSILTLTTILITVNIIIQIRLYHLMENAIIVNIVYQNLA